MTPDRWSRLQRLFAEALLLSGAQRDDWLERATAGDDALRDEVRTLLEGDAAPDGSVERAIAAEAARVLDDHAAGDHTALFRALGKPGSSAK